MTPTSPAITLKGTPYNIRIDFPFYERIVLRISIMDQAGAKVQTLQLPMTMLSYVKYQAFFPVAYNFLTNLFNNRKG